MTQSVNTIATTTPDSILSLDDFLALPETEPASEYVNGAVVQKPMPKGKHSVIQFELAQAINQYAKPKKIAYALPELRCTFAGRSLVPDVAVMRWENLPLDADGEIADRFDAPPDWAIEILSPDQSATIVMEKLIFCLSHGTELGWLIDPQAKSISVFSASGLPQVYLLAQMPNEVMAVVAGLEGLRLTVSNVFGWLRV